MFYKSHSLQIRGTKNAHVFSHFYSYKKKKYAYTVIKYDLQDNSKIWLLFMQTISIFRNKSE